MTTSRPGAASSPFTFEILTDVPPPPARRIVMQFIRFDPQRRATGSLKERIDAFQAFLEAGEVRKRARRDIDKPSFAVAVEALACNLLVLAMVAPERTLAVPRSNGVMFGGGRYASAVYGAHFLKLMDHMIALGLISQPQLGYNMHKKGQKAPTLIRPEAALSDHLPVGRTTWDDFTREPVGEVLILKNLKTNKGSAALLSAADRDNEDDGERIDYPETSETTALRRQVEEINALIAAASIGLDMKALKSPITTEGIIIDPTMRQLRRVFNNGRWDHSGRLFHGFWENLSKIDRNAALRIDGEPVANVDFRQLFPRLAYARGGVPVPMDDLYDIERIGPKDPNRDGWKVLVNALLFHVGEKDPDHWPEDTAPKFSPRRKLTVAQAAIRARHPAIAPLFGKGVGFEFMHTESKILVEVLPKLFALGITALPLHDSVLTARSKAPAAKALLEDAYRRETGQLEAFVEVDYGTTSKT